VSDDEDPHDALAAVNEDFLLALVWDSDQLTEAAQSVIEENLKLRAERDRLRAVVDVQAASLARLKEFAESEILDRVSTELGADLRRQLDVSPEVADG
jgi:regulator of replication initiation timing